MSFCKPGWCISHLVWKRHSWPRAYCKFEDRTQGSGGEVIVSKVKNRWSRRDITFRKHGSNHKNHLKWGALKVIKVGYYSQPSPLSGQECHPSAETQWLSLSRTSLLSVLSVGDIGRGYIPPSRVGPDNARPHFTPPWSAVRSGREDPLKRRISPSMTGWVNPCAIFIYSIVCAGAIVEQNCSLFCTCGLESLPLSPCTQCP